MTFSAQVEITETRTAIFDIDATDEDEAKSKAQELAKTERPMFTCVDSVQISFFKESKRWQRQ